MCGRVIAVLLLLLSSFPVFPQCTFTRTHGAAFRASYLDVAIDGGDLWAVTGYGVQVYDRSRDVPVLIASAAVPENTKVVRVSGGLAYVGSGRTLNVFRRNGTAIQHLRAVDAGGTINDLLITGGFLFAGTSAGLVEFSLTDPTQPVRLNVSLPTSSPNVTSLALEQFTLYAADGDSSVEMFSLGNAASPFAVGTLRSLARSLAVHVANHRIYVSDGINTEVFISGSSAGTTRYGTTTLLSLRNDAVFAAGDDRRFHALDLTVPGNAVELFEADLAPLGGTINRIGGMATADGRLYVAAGDLGLLTYDLATFTAPYPVRSYATGSSSSIFTIGNSSWAAASSGGLVEYTANANGALTTARTWGGNTFYTVHDGAGGFLVTSNGGTLSYWTLTSTTPTLLRSYTLRAAVIAAAVSNGTLYAVLDDGSLWSVAIGGSAAPAEVTLGGFRPSIMVRSGTFAVLGQIRNDGTTELRGYPNFDFAAAPQSVTIEGVPTGGVAVNGTQAAVFTFRGLTLIDFGSRTATVIPQSNSTIPRGLLFAGSRLLVLTDRGVQVWDVATRRLVRTLALPADALALSGDATRAVVATSDGVVSVAFEATQQLPSQLAAMASTAYYRKIVAAAGRLYAFDGRGVEVFATTNTVAPEHLASVRGAALIDVAASDAGVFTLSANGTVSAWSRNGVLIAQKQLSEGADAQPLSIFSAAGVPWVSFSSGCLSGGCVKKTLVLEPQTLVATRTLDGAVVDITTTASRAYALFNLPSEVRVYNLADPLHPVALATRAIEGEATSVAASNGTVYTLGDKLYSYSETSLTKSSEAALAGSADAAQRIRIDGTCAVISGRTLNPQFYTAGAWSSPATPIAVPATVRSIATVSGRIYLLTDYSIEVLDSAVVPKPATRRHSAR